MILCSEFLFGGQKFPNRGALFRKYWPQTEISEQSVFAICCSGNKNDLFTGEQRTARHELVTISVQVHCSGNKITA